MYNVLKFNSNKFCQQHKSGAENVTTIFQSSSENIVRINIDDHQIASSQIDAHSIELIFANGNQGQATLAVYFFCAHVMVTESMTAQAW